MRLSDKKVEKYGMIQFRAHTPELREQLIADVARSPYKDATEYLQFATEKVVNLEGLLGGKSGIEELWLNRNLVEALPLDIVREIASAQNRNCDQMVVQLIQEAIPNYYRFENGKRHILHPSDLVESRLLAQRLLKQEEERLSS